MRGKNCIRFKLVLLLVAIAYCPCMNAAVPPLIIPPSISDWNISRKAIRTELVQLLGDLPARPAEPKVKVLKVEQRGDIIVEKIEIENGAGDVIPAYVVKSIESKGKHPAILYCHWHGGEYDIGKEELFQKKHTPEIPAFVLAKQGYIVIAPDAYGFGERSGKGPGGPAEKGSKEEMSLSKLNLWYGRTLWGMIVRDDQIALDYLISRSDVDSSRIGCTGISMGATRTWWLTALDERIKSGVAVACLTRYQELIENQQLAAHGIYYFVPGILKHFDTEAIVSLSAPRPMLFMTGDQDGGSPAAGIRRINASVEKIYQLYGKADSFQSEIYPQVGHEYTPEMWQKMVGWFGKNL
ncbi:MAG: Dienelactone hydrolase [Verrucomicrobiales bacterium]|nr:Dienelactone hydrolase [Verrucomicrobiales bacterium]